MGPAVGTQTETSYHLDITPRYEQLVKKYEQMRQQVRFYREAHAILLEKYRRDKVVWKQWVAQDTARRQKSEKLKAHNAALDGLVDPVTPEALVELPEITPHASIRTPISQVAARKHWSSSLPPIEKSASPGINSLAPGVSEVAPARIHTEDTVDYGSDLTTDSEGEANIATCSPLPNAIHSNSELREPPTLPKLPAKVKAEETTQCLDYAPIYIKSEPCSPNSVLDHIPFTQQSLDLDDIGYKPKTPRKKKHISSRSLQVNYEQGMSKNVSPTLSGNQRTEISKEQQKGDVTRPFDPFVNSASPASQVFVVNESENQANSQSPCPPNGTSTPTNVHQVEIPDMPAGDSAKTIARYESTASIQSMNRKLAQLTSQRRSKAAMLPPSGRPRGTRRPRELKLLNSGIGFMTEDGINFIDSLTEPPPTEVPPRREQPLGKLLDTSPQKLLSIAHLRKGLGGIGNRGVTPIRISNNPGNGRKFATPDTNKQPGKHNIPTTDPPVSKRSKCITRSERKPDRTVSARGPKSGSVGMLRYCDVKELQASDFVINADKAYGRNYAHQEVIRKHDERKCLPGCLKVCCAGLKDFLEKAGMPPTVSNAPKWRSSPDPSSPQCDDTEERDPNADQAREFVNKVSKHRSLFERNKSPPGFWNSEFPTTQEADERRKQAIEGERRRVAEMKEEAKKGNGRYFFRDEVRRRGGD